MQVLENLFIGLEHAGLVVGDTVIPAEASDDRLPFSQLVAGQPREQVVFDLVVEASVPEVGDRVGDDVAAGQYLSAQEVHLAVTFQKGHSFVVGCEDRDHVGAEEPAMDGDEEQRLQRFQHREQQAEVHHEVCSHEERFGQRALFSMRNWMLLRCMLSPCRIDSGKIKAAWYFTTKRASPRLSKACSSSKARSGISTSGSTSNWFGCP
jgi:hypothetical protein